MAESETGRRSERMVVRPANPIVNSARREGPDCLAALAA
jgi:hypothetical protein